MMVDEANQKVLQAAVKLYAYDKNALPASLSRLRPQDLRRATALVTEGKKPYTLWAYLKECVQGRTALAETVLPPAYYHHEVRVLICPADRTPPTEAGDSHHRSYGIHPGAAGKPLSWLLDPTNASAILIWETQDDGVTPEARHNGCRENVITRVEGGSGRSSEGRSGGGDGGDNHGNEEYGNNDDDEIQNTPPGQRKNKFAHRINQFLQGQGHGHGLSSARKLEFIHWLFDQFNGLPGRTERIEFMRNRHLRDLLEQFRNTPSTHS